VTFEKDWNDFWSGAGQYATYIAKKVGMTDDDIGYARYLIGSVPFLSDIASAAEGNQKALSYMHNRNIPWSKVVYASNLPGYGSGSGLVNRGMNYVSRNIGRLYS